MTNDELDRELAEVVNKMARRYARRWWWADEEDLRQTAWVGALIAKRKYDPAKARCGIKPFVRSQVHCHLSRYMTAFTSPVSASDHQRYALVGLTRAPLEHAGCALEDQKTPETKLEIERWRAKVRVRLRCHAGSEAVLDSLLDGQAPTPEAVDAFGRIMRSTELRHLLKERSR